jgi:maltooligosyltrehalose synthase
MIPREEHLKQVNRFHDMLEKVDKEIESQGLNNTSNELLFQYFTLTGKVWPLVDDSIEKIKDRLDEFERK